MKFTNKILNALASQTRKLKYHRKLNQLYKHFNRLFLALGADPKVKVKMTDGTEMLVDLSTKTERISFYTGKYDPELIEITHKLFNADHCFLDVGANIGYYSVSMSQFIRSKNTHGRVISFEPFEGNFKRLSGNIESNDLNHICTLNAFGLSNESLSSQITLREDFKHGSTTGNAAIPTSDSMDEGFELSPIKLERLDDVWAKSFNKYGIIDFIKMDIEGHEDFCLEGGQKTINTFRPTILMEVNKPYYVARGVSLDDRFFKLIPDKYLVFRYSDSKWKQISSLDECTTIDNVFLIPEEKLKLDNFQMFNVAV